MGLRKKTIAVGPAAAEVEAGEALESAETNDDEQLDPTYPDLTSPHARGIVRRSEALKWL